MDRYAQQAAEQARELASSLSEREIQVLREALVAATAKEFLDWRSEFQSDILEFVRATPSQRRRKTYWKVAFPQLTYAAYLHCRDGVAVLGAIARFDLTPGGPYRHMTSQAGLALRAMQDARLHLPQWPWAGKKPLHKKGKASASQPPR